MPEFQMSLVNNYREKTFRLNESKRIKNPEQSLEYINERGFVFFWPIKDAYFPNLWSAVAGDRPVPNEHDDPGHISWGWKDQALGKRMWYYAKILRKKSTFISLDILPYFYAMSENFGSPDEDYLISYQDGHLSLEEKIIYESILKNGPMHTIDLKLNYRLAGMERKSRFNRALDKLQSEFRILPVGIAEAGTWNYTFIYDLTSHHFPDLPSRARLIGEWEARKKLVEYYFLSMGAAYLKEIQKLFRWDPVITLKVLEMLLGEGFISSNHDQSENPPFQYWLPQFTI